MTTMTYRGFVRGNMVELEKGVQLPEGEAVDVVVREQDTELLAPSGYPRGSRQALLAALDSSPHCTEEDVDTLMEAIERGKQPLCFAGVFDPKGK